MTRHTDRHQQARKQQVLTHASPSSTSSIADAIVVKNDRLYFVCADDGNVPLDGTHGLGLYHDDCRILDGYHMQLAGVGASPLVATADRGFMATIALANPEIKLPNGSRISKETMGIIWERVADGSAPALHDRITFVNYGQEPLEVPVTFTFRARFQDIFVVRGMIDARTGTLHAPTWDDDDALHVAYDGVDGVQRRVHIALAPRPDRHDDTTAHFTIRLEPRQRTDVRISIALSTSDDPHPHSADPNKTDTDQVIGSLESASQRWLDHHASARTDSVLFDRLLHRSQRDLDMLRTEFNGSEFFAAGVPWFTTLFGRDSVITALQSLAFDRRVAEQTIDILGHYQGRKVDAWRDEEPGKILHELRVDELTRAGEVPYSPYYGTIDATPLFLILIGAHAAWAGDLAIFESRRAEIESALRWIDNYGDLDGDGYLEYDSASSDNGGIVNQGWKDSGNAILDQNGKIPRTPIALVEVQAYVYLAKRMMADLFRRSGDDSRADALSAEATALRERFNRDFWLTDRNCYALALDGNKRPLSVIASNAGHALWTGIADRTHARRTMERLMADDMFGGWGIRTLSSNERGYNPISYHLGSVWPHDNSIIAAGFRRYGFDDAAKRVFGGVLAAASEFEHGRLPELFAGYSREAFSLPVRYPVANHPQAWGAGSIPYLLVTMLGLVPEAFDRRLRIVRPFLPEFVDRLRLEGLRVGTGSVDLRFVRRNEDVDVEITDVTGGVDVVIDRNDESDAAGSQIAEDSLHVV